MYNEKYYNNLHRSYKTHKKLEHQTPYANRITDFKRSLISKGLPIYLENGKVNINDRGDLLITYENGETGFFIDVPDDKIKLIENTDNEYILCAANHYDDGIVHIHQPFNIKTGFVICGQRHHNCIYTFSLIVKDISREETVKLMQKESEGFLTNTNRFVDRHEGLIIARKANQLNDERINERTGLHSENLY